MLAVRDLAVGFATARGLVKAVDGVSFDLAPGEVMGLVGESGSGKTVTCRSIIRLLPAGGARILGGTVRLDGVDLLGLDEDAMAEVRGGRIGMIFQHPASHLDPVMAIGEQIGETLRFHDGLARREARQRSIELLRQVRMPDPARRVDDFAHQLSGGMRQRAMIAAALASSPSVLIADEPTTALDVTVQAQILRLLLDLRDARGLAIILVTHDLGVVSQTCDTIAVMYAGRIVERGPTAPVLATPRHPYTEALLRSLPGTARPGEPLNAIAGQPPSAGASADGCAFRDRCGHAADVCAAGIPPLVIAGPSRLSACARIQSIWGPA